MTPILLATRNRYKIAELRAFLGDLPVDVKSVDEVDRDIFLDEDSDTFQGNALSKARIVFARTKVLALADDSGLEVFYLNGRPGVRSARYSGEDATDEKNNSRLLAEMRGVAPRRRKAQFRAVLALVGPGFVDIAEGVCPGHVAERPRGTNGFGYDPIFIPEGYTHTYAELTQEEKNRISHRSRAFAQLREIIQRRIRNE